MYNNKDMSEKLNTEPVKATIIQIKENVRKEIILSQP